MQNHMIDNGAISCGDLLSVKQLTVQKVSLWWHSL
jgi:hypothetical protein